VLIIDLISGIIKKYLTCILATVTQKPSVSGLQKAKTSTDGLQISTSTSAQAKQTASKVLGYKGYITLRYLVVTLLGLGFSFIIRLDNSYSVFLISMSAYFKIVNSDLILLILRCI